MILCFQSISVKCTLHNLTVDSLLCPFASNKKPQDAAPALSQGMFCTCAFSIMESDSPLPPSNDLIIHFVLLFANAELEKKATVS